MKSIAFVALLVLGTAAALLHSEARPARTVAPTNPSGKLKTDVTLLIRFERNLTKRETEALLTAPTFRHEGAFTKAALRRAAHKAIDTGHDVAVVACKRSQDEKGCWWWGCGLPGQENYELLTCGAAPGK